MLRLTIALGLIGLATACSGQVADDVDGNAQALRHPTEIEFSMQNGPNAEFVMLENVAGQLTVSIPSPVDPAQYLTFDLPVSEGLRPTFRTYDQEAQGYYLELNNGAEVRIDVISSDEVRIDYSGYEVIARNYTLARLLGEMPACGNASCAPTVALTAAVGIADFAATGTCLSLSLNRCVADEILDYEVTVGSQGELTCLSLCDGAPQWDDMTTF